MLKQPHGQNVALFGFLSPKIDHNERIESNILWTLLFLIQKVDVAV